MPSLAELQRQMAQALLGDPDVLAPTLFSPGPIAASVALRVHRNTVYGGLSQALALSYPTVQALVGEAFFDRAAAEFAEAEPPVQARLDAFGHGFADFLAAYAPAQALPYLADVARFDLAIETAGRCPRFERLVPIETQIVLSLPISLSVLDLAWPADSIRDAVESEREGDLAGVDLAAGPVRLAVWRGLQGPAARRLSPAAADFLSALTACQDVDDALSRACATLDPEAALLTIQSEIFAAPFAKVLQTPPQT